MVLFNWNLTCVNCDGFMHLVAVTSVLHSLTWWLVKLDGEAFDQVSYLTTVTVDEFDVVLVEIWHKENEWHVSKNSDFF